MKNKFSHMDGKGDVKMVNVTGKGDTTRIAIAQGEVVMNSKTLDAIESGTLKKGNLYTVAKLAGIMAAKRTDELIPLCHSIPINNISVVIEPNHDLPGVEITASVETISKTGVEMEALTAVSMSALTVYDMAKAVDKSMRIQNIRLVEKRGGQSGLIINK